MALSDTNRALRALFGKLGTSDIKRIIEEIGAETINLHLLEIWADDIFSGPTQGIIDGFVESRTLFALTEDVTVPGQAAWRAVETGTPLIDWIPPDKYDPAGGPDYTTAIFDGSDALITVATQVNEGIFFDHKTGVLTINGSPGSFTQPFKVSGFRYIGSKGGSLTPTPVGDLYTCSASVTVGDAVYISGLNTVDRAIGSATPTPDAIGLATSKPTGTSCRVLSTKGRTPGIFGGLIVGATYYLSDSVAGGITTTPPPATAVGTKVQEIGIAVSTTELFLDIDATSTIN